MKISFNRFVAFGITPFLLMFLWLILSLFFASKYSLSVISVAYNKTSLVSLKTDELLAKQKVSARFRAIANNLGIVSVRFKTYGRINNDEVVFRLREEGKKNWYYDHTYRVDQFQDDDYFTFGLPIISNSEGKTYYFEIESTKGKRGDAVSISATSPVFITQYQFTKQKLLANKTIIPDFLIKKIHYSFSDINFTISAFIYALPFLFYMLWFFYFKKYLPPIQIKNLIVKYKMYVSPDNYILLYVYIFVFILSIFFKNKILLSEEIILIFLWLGLIRIYILHSSVTFFLALASLSISPIFLILNSEIIAENAAMWAYLFLLIGTIQAIYGLYKKAQPLRAIQLLLRELSDNRYFKKIKKVWDRLP